MVWAPGEARCNRKQAAAAALSEESEVAIAGLAGRDETRHTGSLLSATIWVT